MNQSASTESVIYSRPGYGEMRVRFYIDMN